MVLSIMQILGVALDPKGFHADDRMGATIALAQGLLKLHNGWSPYLTYRRLPSTQYSRDFDENELKNAPTSIDRITWDENFFHAQRPKGARP